MAGSVVFTPAARSRADEQPLQLVGLDAGRRLAASRRPGQHPRRPGAAPGACTSPGRMSPPTRPGRAKTLPTEAEWEFAGRGGHDGWAFAWGDELAPKGKMLANYWQGEFPWQNLALDGYERTAPVGSFPPNGYGLFDMIGNAWEWTADWYTDRHEVGQRLLRRRRSIHAAAPGRASVDPNEPGGHPAQGAQGRLLRLCRELLPAVPSRGAHAPPHRHRHQPHQLPLRRPARRGRRRGTSA